MLLLIAIVTPLLGACLTFSQRMDTKATFLTGLITSTVSFLIFLWMWIGFDLGAHGFQYTFSAKLPWFDSVDLWFGLDGLSLTLSMLTAFITPLCVILTTRLTQESDNLRRFMRLLLLLDAILITSFSALDIFLFYIFFESSLIPMFLIVGAWGSRPRRIKASYYLFFFTLTGSIFMLFGIFSVYQLTGSTLYPLIVEYSFSVEQQKLLWLCFFLAFATKVPMIPFHIWLPEAHVEAPTIGSIILASLLLKLGGYGFLRFSIPLFPEGTLYFSSFILLIALVSVIYSSLTTIRQIDIKRIIAYSSIAHMNIGILGLFSLTQQGVDGAMYLMLGHGFVSGALFFLIGVLYDRYHTRLIYYYGGLVETMPVYALLLFICTIANVGFPGTCNFVGELLSLIGIFLWSSSGALLVGLGVVLSAVYSMWLYNRLMFGTLKTQYILRFSDVDISELSIAATFIFCILFFGVSTTSLTELYALPVNTILSKFL